MQYETVIPSMDLFPQRRMMEEDVLTNLSVTDVYDQAAGIGKEFEKLIESYGVDAVTDLMPKVIRSLEQLEALASRYEKESGEIADLKYAVDKLEAEKADKVQERARFEEELIQIEETWQKESRDQIMLIGRLQEENRRLKTSLSEQKQAIVEEVAAVTKKTEEKEIEVLTKLKETVDKQREDLRKMKREMTQKSVDVEALQAQTDRLVKVNIDLRRKNSTHRKHARSLLTDKVELETQLAEKEQQITQVKEMLRDQESLDDNLQLKHKLSSITEETENVDVKTATMVTADGTQTEVEGQAAPADESPEKLVEKLSLIGKVVIDPKDPNRPRFTLNELRTVLMERNELKAQLIEVEEELDKYKPSPPENDYEIVPPSGTHAPSHLVDELDQTKEEEEDLDADDDEEDEERPVQGPINREPAEKLYPYKRPSAIRKFFNNLFGTPPSERKHGNSRRTPSN